MDVELKPCPFCGGQPKVGETNTGVPGMEDCGYAFVECCFVHVHSGESVEDAVELWNIRRGAGDADHSPDAGKMGEAEEGSLRFIAKRNLRRMIEIGSTDKATMLLCLEELS